MRYIVRLSVGLLCLCLFACAQKQDKVKKVYGKTLADLRDVPLEEEPMPVPIASLDKIEEVYQAALEVAEAAQVRHGILIRLADIEMARSETDQIDATEQKAFFSDAISMYEELLALNAQRQGEEGVPTNERLLYQLSKAYALDGRIEESDAALNRLVSQFPDSGFSAEADFRQAELSFTNGDYSNAEILYAKVMASGKDTPFYINAVYMHGWSRFKRGRYRAAIPSFTEVLDLSLIEGKAFDALSNSQKNIANDTLRILSIIFSYLDGAETIVEVYTSLGVRHYQHFLYAALGELYFEKDRFRDSANTYEVYVRQFPNTDHSPGFSVKAIDVYQQAGFPSLVLPAKETYVKNYGVYSVFWRDRDDLQRNQLKPNLKVYLGELSSYYHAEAQALDTARAEFEKAVAAGKKPKEKKKPGSGIPNYLRAAEYYGEFVFTFPQDKQTPEMTFLQAEALYSAERRAEAVEAYETVAYEYIDQQYGANAGYSAILTMTELIDAGKDKRGEEAKKQMVVWQTRKINSAVAFAKHYAADKRALPVLTKAAQELFEQSDLSRAAEVAEQLTAWQPRGTPELQKTAWLILAHSRFDLQQYAEAEVAYRQLLTRLSAKDPQRNEIIERIAASIYRQAEIQVASGKKAGAIEQLLSIASIAPKSDIASTAHYDAINYLIELQQWGQAETQLDAFKKQYPQHELIPTLTPKYAKVYQASEQWGKAAVVINQMSQSADPEQQRTFLYLSAELFERSGDVDKAIINYRKYAHTYPEPFDIATEARFHLVELYEKTKQPSKREFWLKELINENAEAGDNSTTRSRYLAAMAMNHFAGNVYYRFARVKLTLPIKASMKKKKALMDEAIGYYKKIMQFGIADFVTEANHHIALLYGQLSADLMDSQRPKGLDELALEQYEILLEEQAFPFEEKAIDIFAENAARTQKGIYDDWVKASFKELAKLLPARYGKQEVRVEVADELF